MCDHTNDLGGREAAMVVLDPGTPERHGRDGVWCDPCLVPLVKALNDGGVRTVASCCGHGEVYGSIALDDGRWLTIMPDADWRAWDARINQAQIATQEPAGATQGGSGGSRTLADRLRAAADYQDRPGAYDELRAMADEVDVLVEKRARQAQTIGELQLVRERLTGQATRVQAVAQWFRGQGLVGYARKVEEAVEGVGDARRARLGLAVGRGKFATGGQITNTEA